MSDTKELNNEELEEVAGGEISTDYEIFPKGSWLVKLKGFGEGDSVSYVKDVIDNRYHIIDYSQGRTNSREPSSTRCRMKDIGLVPFREISVYYRRVEKPDWITEDPSL